MKESARKKELDQLTIQIEFLLISVVQGVALAALATAAASIIGSLDLEHIIYVISAFLFILIFWSSAVSHVLSFIDWPLDLTHNFLYFLASFFEVMAFSYLKDPARWFGFISMFLFVIGILYIWDLRLIKEHKNSMKKNLYDDVLKEQKYELSVLFPAGFTYSLFATAMITLYSQIFISLHYHILFAGIQAAFGLFVLVTSIKAFKRRARLLEE